MGKGVLIVALTALLLTSYLSGCVEKHVNKQDDETLVLTAAEIKTSFLNAIKEVTSYKYSINGTIHKVTTNSSGNFTENESLIQNGVVNISSKRLMIDQEYNGHTIYYLIDNVLYEGDEDDEGIINWSSHDMRKLYSDPSNQSWIAFSQLERQAYFVLNHSRHIERLGDESVGNISCYVLNASLDFGPNVDVKWDTIRYWLSKEDHLLVKAYLKVTWNMGNSTDANNESAVEVQDMNLFFYDYNKPVEVTLPDEITWS
ncbi:MAG: hypothetical protein J7L32_07545 [Thermoplasmata archaeon]|nr:hypothetical protein [Thermoplasmata archaeon]RLF25847.1 MAG: hypothetical protein DRN01_05920 [Thermoplasmata archaeon]